MTLGIPKRLGHIWIGPLKPPAEWMQSWRDHHASWDYHLYDNDFLFSRRWRTQPLINEYYRRGEYAGVSDLMRYEILHDVGGFIPEADSLCLRPTDELWTEPNLYTVYENEEKKPGLVSPFLASTPKHPYLDAILKRIVRRNAPETLGAPWWAVGNKFLKRALATQPADAVTIFPSHYFIPKHKDSPRYDGDGPVYCDQFWGSTLHRYEKPEGVDIEALRKDHIAILESKLT
jgi:mannosyltransferase OCH1-like enzyme